MSKRFKKRFKNVALFAKPRAENMRDTIAAIAALVERAGQTVLLDLDTRNAVGLDRYPGLSIEAIGQNADVAIVPGGDGTMLGVAREMAPFHVPLIGINQGRLGFITDIALDQVEEVLPTMLAGQYEVDHRSQIDAELVRHGTVAYNARALNDIVVSRGVAGGMVEFTVRVDRVTMYNQRGDGVILATPTGSTPYSPSANGPIPHPPLARLVLVPAAPQTLSNRPIALADSAPVEIEITHVRDASAHFDMQTFAPLSPSDIVRARKARDVVTLLHPIGYNYFATLRSKLHWSVMPSEPHGHL